MNKDRRVGCQQRYHHRGYRSCLGAMLTLKLWIGRPKEVRASLRDDPVGHGRLAAVVDFGQRDDISKRHFMLSYPKYAIPVFDTWESMAYDLYELE